MDGLFFEKEGVVCPTHLWHSSSHMSATGNIDAIIVGGGIAGLALALSLKKHFGIIATVFEQAPRFGIKFKPTRFFL